MLAFALLAASNHSKVLEKRKSFVEQRRKMDTLYLKANIEKKEALLRPLANFAPDIWADQFINYTADNELTRGQMLEEAKQLKELVRNNLLGVPKDPKERLEYVDVVHRLGLAYHFEKEIEDNLKNFYMKSYNDDCYMNDLHYVSLSFRLLRQHGYHVLCDVFDKFTDKDGSLKDCLANDVQGILNLYEASYLKVHGETILDDALVFSITHLTSKVEQLNNPIAEQIMHALELPLHKRSIRLESRYQISYYESKSSHDKTLLKFAKLDFNLLQELHKEELRDFTGWSRSLDSFTKLPGFMRERVVEAYFWSLAVYHEPKYVYGRMCVSKLLKIASVIDDLYDSYGTLEELQSFTEAIQRWEESCANEIPEYMKLFYQAILDTFKEIEQILAKEGRAYAIYYLKQQMIATCQAYLQKQKWCHENFVPSYDAYVKNGVLSSGYLYTLVASYLGMGDATKAAFEWIHPDSKAPKASCVLARLINDISSHKFEQNRNHAASAVECYMKQFGICEEEAYNKIQIQMEETWKDMNEDMLCQMTVPKSMVNVVINLSRALNDFYKIGEDAYTTNKYMRPKIAAVLIDPMTI